MAGYFITGTDTGIGKTYATVALMRWFRRSGVSVIGMKPVASGCFFEDGELRNEDALLLQENASVRAPYSKLNVYVFEPPVSPHIAARKSGQVVGIEPIVKKCRSLEGLADRVLVEGVGGWEVPINDGERVSDLAKALELPVILVVGMRLGCLNHAILTSRAIIGSGVPFSGWIGNCVNQSFSFLEENLQTLRTQLPVPCLGVIPYGGKFEPDADGEALLITGFP